MRTVRRFRDLLSTAQERFEGSPLGEVLISALVSMIVSIAVVWSSPDSAIRRSAVPPLEPVASFSGLDQGWYMFAPDPIRRLETVEVRVHTVDGDERVWAFPQGNVLDQFSWYRWHKLKEQSVRTPELRPGIARWVARQVAEPPDYPVRVEMILSTEAFPAPSGSNSDGFTGIEILYVETLSGPS